MPADPVGRSRSRMEVALPRSFGRRRLTAPVVLLALAGAFAIPSAAQAADTQSCYGKVTPIEPTVERDTGASYEFTCAEPIKGFAISTTDDVVSFDVSADIFEGAANGGALRGDDRFNECEGDIPGLGFTCAGTYFGFGRVIKATFDTMDSPCARDASRHVALRTSLVVQSFSGKLSGPFDLGRTTGCPKPAKAVENKKSKRSKKAKAKRGR